MTETLEARAEGLKALEWAESAGQRIEAADLMAQQLQPHVRDGLRKRAKRDKELAEQHLDAALTSARAEGAREALEQAAEAVNECATGARMAEPLYMQALTDVKRKLRAQTATPPRAEGQE